ncbi:hypothetical protein L917_21507, partial [Phytophthora nicotianae]
LRELTRTPSKGVEVSIAHQLRELTTRQAVLVVASAQNRKCLCARVQPGLIIHVRGNNPPTVTKVTETCPRPGLDEKHDAGLHKKRQRKSWSGTETLQSVSAGQTPEQTLSVETLNVLTQTRTGLEYRSMTLENPPTSASELTSLPAMGWMRIAKDLFDERIEQICIL